MTFYQLTDPIRRGDVIRAEGRKHYTYSFGACRWVRTAALMAYLDEESPLYGQYEQIDEQTALELVLAKNRALLQQQTAAEARMQHLCGERCDELGIRWADRLRQEAEALPDLEQKITALLQKEFAFGGTVQALHEAGFHPRIVRAVRLLTQTPGTDFYAYIRGLRRDEIARAVKTEDLNWLVDRKRLTQGAPLPEQTRTQALAALRYLAMEGELPERTPTDGAFVPALDARKLASRAAMQGRKTPHGLSNPVLRATAGGVFLAYFVHLYQKADLDSGMLPRPQFWLLADLKTGEVLRRIACSEEDFSTLAADARLSTAGKDGPAQTTEDFQALYARLDGVRRTYLQTGAVDEQAYEAYFTQMLQAVPPAWRRCYAELSRL